MNLDCQRWAGLSDRQAVGQTLGAEEDEFLRRHPRLCDDCSREDAAWRALRAPALVEGPASTDAVNRVLAGALSADTRQRVRQRWTAAAVGTLAMAAAVAFWFARGGETQSGRHLAFVAARSGADAAAFDPASTSPSPFVPPGACSELSSGILACTARDTLVENGDLRSKERVLALGRGRILVSLSPQPAGTSFSIVTQVGRVTAVGTVFSVESTEDGGLITRVLEGKVAVRVTESSDVRFVRAGESLRLGDAQTTTLTTEERERDLALLPPERRAQLSSTLEGAAASNAARAATPDALLERALALRAQGEFRQASEIYRKIHEMSPKSAAGGTALISRGELLLSSLNDPRGALACFEVYLGQGGALSREAAFGRVRALRTLGRTAEERRAIGEFLSQHPNAPQSRVLRQRLSALGQRPGSAPTGSQRREAVP